MHRMVRRVGDASARRPWVTIGAWVIALALVLGLAAAFGGTLVDDYDAPGSQSAEASELLRERFPEASGGSAVAVFAVQEGQRVERHRPAIQAALARMARKPHVKAVADPFTPGTVSPDGRVAYATLTFDRPSTELGWEPLEEVAGTLKPVRDAGAMAELGGEAAFINAKPVNSGTELVGVLAALVVLIVAFGTVAAALLPVALALVTVGAGVATIFVFAGTMDVSTSAPTVGAMIGLGVGIDYALFIMERYRQNRAGGQDNAAALSDAMASAGSAAVLAGGTVVLAMGALLLTGLGMIASAGVGTALVVLFAVATALTLLPALLSLLGDRVDAWRLPGRRRAAKPAERTAWWRFAHHVSGKPWPYLIAASAVLLTLAAPALRMETAFPDAGDEAPGASHRRAYELLAEGFGPGINGPLLIVADLRATGASVSAIAERVAADPGIATVGEPRSSAAGDTVVLPAVPTTAPTDPRTSQTLDRVRDVLPAGVTVAGLTATTDDVSRQLSDTLPIFVGAVLLASFLLLMMVFRSVAVPLKAVVMNLLSIGGAYGVVVAVFQWGWLGGLFGLEETYQIASPLPVVFFAVLFGLSMDYEVFLLSRIREHYDATGDTAESVARGVASTGRVITSAALIMTVVFLGFVANPHPMVTMLGLGLATAIVLDATIVRMVLVPATMALLGRANWWLPGWLDRLLPRVGTAEIAPEPEPEPVKPLATASAG
ncbi:MMPL family transporter [Actinomadura sp. SCN-SB]|uniref:MMPL family transporter n=1 Tax=Actinomadura sp. SCN-SB TaxID=3373092 RepID=UPI0037520168